MSWVGSLPKAAKDINKEIRIWMQRNNSKALFCRTYAYIQFVELQKYAFEKYDVFEKYEYISVEYNCSKGKYAHTCIGGLKY